MSSYADQFKKYPATASFGSLTIGKEGWPNIVARGLGKVTVEDGIALVVFDGFG
jgi:hypothetical protein